MVGFEILVNGKPAYTTGFDSLGSMWAQVVYTRKRETSGEIWEELHMQGLATELPDSPLGTIWKSVPTKIGDEIIIRIVDTNRPDPGEVAQILAHGSSA